MPDATTLLPGDTGYAGAVAAFSLLHVPAPPRALVARTTQEVVDAVRTARALGLRVVAFSTGHAAERLGSVEDALLVRVRIEEPVVVDGDARTVRIPAGATWAEVASATAERGLLAPWATC